jgi:hypothetical protein
MAPALLAGVRPGPSRACRLALRLCDRAAAAGWRDRHDQVMISARLPRTVSFASQSLCQCETRQEVSPARCRDHSLFERSFRYIRYFSAELGGGNLQGGRMSE